MILILLSACSDRYKLKNKIDGKYVITNYESRSTNHFNCVGVSDLLSFSVDNPGKLVFLGKKVIDGTSASPSERPYYGYFEYEYNTAAYAGAAMSTSGKKYFQYDVLDVTGSVDSTQIFGYIDQKDYDISYELEGNKITAFKFTSYAGCFKTVETHTVK